MSHPSQIFAATVALLLFQVNLIWANSNLIKESPESWSENGVVKNGLITLAEEIKSRNDRGIAYMKRKDLDAAVSEFNKALNVAVAKGSAQKFGEGYAEPGDEKAPPQAINTINRENARTRNNLGLIYLQRGKLLIAKKEFFEAIKLNPNFSKPHNNLGIIFEGLDNADKAIQSYLRSHQLDPRNPENLYNLGLAYDSRGDGGNSLHYMVLSQKAYQRISHAQGMKLSNAKLETLWKKYAAKPERNEKDPRENSFTSLPPVSSHLNPNLSSTRQEAKVMAIDLPQKEKVPNRPLNPHPENAGSISASSENKEETRSASGKISASGPTDLAAKVKPREEFDPKPVNPPAVPATNLSSGQKVPTPPSPPEEPPQKNNTKDSKISDWIFEYPK